MSDSEQDIWTMIASLGHSRHRHEWDSIADVIQVRLSQGEDPDAGRTSPLALAAEMGHLAVVKVLLENGADVHGGQRYRTPLLLATASPDISACLLDHGAKETFFTVVASGKTDRIDEYLRREPALSNLKDEGDQTPLFYAIGANSIEVTDVLLRAESDPRWVAEASYRISPIHQACRGRLSNSATLVDLLVARSANVDAQDKGGVTALHMAVRDRDVAAVRKLLEHGADPNIEDRGRKSTPLRRAVANTGKSGTGGTADIATEITKLLLAHGADPTHVNRSGKRLVDSTRNRVIRELLEHADSGAEI
jgi:uncharacterized protein